MIRLAILVATLSGVISGPHQVLRVVDGDTIVVEMAPGVKATVRLLGIDTPESVPPREPEPCGKEAAQFLRQLLGFDEAPFAWYPGAGHDPRPAKVILLTQTSRKTFGRQLAHVWLPHDGDPHFIEWIMVRYGYAKAWRRSGSPWEATLVHAEDLARENRFGLWDAKSNCAAVAPRKEGR